PRQVIRMLWAEMAGDANDNITISSGRFGESVATKIRWFVVIREGTTYCSCLPIQTYSGKGVGKKGVEKNHHAIIYTGKEPKPQKNEKPKGKEHGMRRPIKVRPKAHTDKLDDMSRINFAKIYTVEHNVKVYDFGKVDPEDEHALLSNFNDIW
ncbi:hypothetical protein EJ08DRAFT_571302, partial [Tothia fuscella]